MTSTTGTFSGGTGDVTVTDTIKKSETGSGSWVNVTTGNSYVVQAEDAGWHFRGTSRATDSAEPANTLNNHSNVLGPVVRPALPEYDVFVNGELLSDPSADVGVLPSGQVVLEVRPKGNASPPADVTYRWQVRTGTGRLSGDESSTGVIYIAPDVAPAGALVTCTVASDHAADNRYAAEVTILVSE